MDKEILIHAENVKKYFPYMEGMKRKYIRAVDGVSLDIFKGETLGLVGESGCGKSTLGRVLLRLREKTDGNIFFEGRDLHTLNSQELKLYRKNMQIVFQDPYACLNPRLRIEDIISEPLRFHGKYKRNERKKIVYDIMEEVGLNIDLARRFPHELSGGQQQRVGIARALILKPKFIVCDEAVSALDVSVQAQILNLLMKLKKDHNLTFLFVSHNLSVVHHICDRIAVMYLGRIVEIASKEVLFSNPVHPYTRALISSILPLEDSEMRERILLKGDLPSPANPPSGCHFHTRCPHVTEICGSEEQYLEEIEPGHFVACMKCRKCF